MVSESSKLKLDNFTLPCVIKGYGRLVAVEKGKQVHGMALKIGLADDVFVDGNLLSMYSKVGDTVSVQRVFDRMENRDSVYWNALMDGYVKHGEIEIAQKLFEKVGDIVSAQRVFDRMENRDLVCWNALMDGYVKRGEIEIARKLFEEMLDRDVVSWTILIDGYSRCGKVDDAGKVFNIVPSYNLTS